MAEKIRKFGKKIIYIQIVFCLIIGFLINDLNFTSMIKYITDIFTGLICLCAFFYFCLKRKEMTFTKKQKISFFIIGVFVILCFISLIYNQYSIVLFAWGIRNTFRFFMFYISCVILLNAIEVKKAMKILYVLIPINSIIILYQFFFANVRGDFINGIFGTVVGNNNAVNAYFCVITAFLLVKLFNNKSKRNMIITVGAILLICLLSALNELKIYYIELAVMIVLFVLLDYKKVHKKMYIGTIFVFVVTLLVSVQVLYKLNPSFAQFFSKPNKIVEYIYSKPYWSRGGEYAKITIEGEQKEIKKINRFSAFEIISKDVFQNSTQFFIGMGIGNCDYSNYAFLTSDNYKLYNELNYTWFSSSFVFIETGLIGFLLYASFFLLFIFDGIRKKIIYKKLHENDLFTSVLSVLCIIFLFYGLSLRSEYSGYIIFLFLSLDSHVKKQENVVAKILSKKYKEKPKVSIIIPIYNVQMYLRKCLSSVVLQSYDNIEAILINDGSIDQSIEICKEFVNSNHNFILIEQKNQGLSAARNKGIDVSSGDFIYFLDSDDYLNYDTIELCVKAQMEYNADIVETGFEYVGNNFPKKSELCKSKGVVIKEEDDLLKTSLDYNIFTIKAAGKLIRKKTVDTLRFEVGKLHEDEFFTPILFSYAKKGVFIDIPCYKYYQRECSIMHTSYSLHRMAAFEAHENRIEKFSAKGNETKAIMNYHYCCCIVSHLELMDDDFKKQHISLVNELKDKAKVLYKDLMKNKYCSNAKKIRLFVYKHFKFILKKKQYRKISNSTVLLFDVSDTLSENTLLIYYSLRNLDVQAFLFASKKNENKGCIDAPKSLYFSKLFEIFILPFKMVLFIRKEKISTIYFNNSINGIILLLTLLFYGDSIKFVYIESEVLVEKNNFFHKFKLKMIKSLTGKANTVTIQANQYIDIENEKQQLLWLTSDRIDTIIQQYDQI